MRKLVIALGVILALVAPSLRAQAPDLKKTIHDMANSLGMLRTLQELDSVMTVEYWGTGTMREVGPQGVGPEIPIKSYYTQIAYDFPGMRVDIQRASGTPQRIIQVVSGTHAWNETEKLGGGLDPQWGGATPAMNAVGERLLQMWTTPFGVVKAAAAAGDQAKVTTEGGAVVLTFPFVNGRPEQSVYMVVGELERTPVKLTLNRNMQPERVEVRFRNRQYVTTYTNYGDLNDADYKADIFLPAHVVQTVDGQTVLDLMIQRSNTYNPYVIVPVPPVVERAAAAR